MSASHTDPPAAAPSELEGPRSEDTASLEPAAGRGAPAPAGHQAAWMAVGAPVGSAPVRQYLSSKTRHRSRTRHRLKVARVELGIVIGIAVLGALIGGLSMLKMSIENDELALHVLTLERTVGELEVKLEAVTVERDHLVRGSNPTLHTLVLDHNTPVDVAYVRDIIFNRAGRPDAARYEFRAVIENNRRGPLVPRVSVLLFDALGVQIGRTDMDPALASKGNVLLEPGEVRGYQGEISATAGSVPAYFRVIVE